MPYVQNLYCSRILTQASEQKLDDTVVLALKLSYILPLPWLGDMAIG